MLESQTVAETLAHVIAGSMLALLEEHLDVHDMTGIEPQAVPR